MVFAALSSLCIAVFSAVPVHAVVGEGTEPTVAEIRANLLRLHIQARPSDHAYKIPGASMEPTFHCARPAVGCEARTSDRVLVRPYAANKHPARGDIVAFTAPPAARVVCGTAGVYLKRVIGLPGEEWSEKNGHVLIDGAKLSEPYLRPAFRDTETWGPKQIATDHYFLMGDNRAKSCDSRRWGSLTTRNLIGKAIAIYWPTARVQHK